MPMRRPFTIDDFKAKEPYKRWKATLTCDCTPQISRQMKVGDRLFCADHRWQLIRKLDEIVCE